MFLGVVDPQAGFAHFDSGDSDLYEWPTISVAAHRWFRRMDPKSDISPN